MKAKPGMITASELRQILFEVRDQEMTVRDLRKMLFDAPNQAAAVPIGSETLYQILGARS